MGSYQAWAPPASGVHPRIWLAPADLTALRARAAGSHAGAWARIIAHCEGKLAGPVAEAETAEPEDLAAGAFVWLVDPARGDLAARAGEYARHLADRAWPEDGRRWLLAMALVYDWASDALGEPARRILRARIAAYVDRYRAPSPRETLGGPALGMSASALLGLLAILSDGSPEENATWKGWMDSLMDQFEGPPGDNSTYLAAARAGAALWAGSGPGSHLEELLGWWGRLLPAMQSGFGILWEGEDWWATDLAGWILWTWRGDRTHHRMGEYRAERPYHPHLQLHALEVALEHTQGGAGADQVARDAWWLAEEIFAAGPDRGALSGGQWIWYLLWDQLLRVIRPTVETGGLAARYFPAAGVAVVRDGWEETGYSLTLEAPPNFLGGRQRRRAGHLNLAAIGVPLTYAKGHGEPAQILTPKDPLSATETGHRYTYAQRAPAANVVRVYSAQEAAQAIEDSFQRLTLGDTRFGVLQTNGTIAISNDGGQRVPKSTDHSRDHPGTLAELLAQSRWQASPWLQTPTESPRYAYAALDLAPYYWTGKVTSYRRHLLWIKAGAIPGWRYPVILLVDDLVTAVDSGKGKLTQVLQIQLPAAPSGSAAAWQVDRQGAQLFGCVLKPTAVEWNTITDFTIEGVAFPAVEVEPFDDPAGVRVEWNGPAAAGSIQFVSILFPCPPSRSAPPAAVLFEDSTRIGATIGGILATVAKASPWTASVGTSADVTPPAVPSGLTATARAGAVDLTWTAGAEGDLDGYRIYRGGALVTGLLITNSWRDEAVVNGTLYSYQVSAVDTSENESAKSAAATATPALGIQGAPRPPAPRRGRRARMARRFRDWEPEGPEPQP